MPPHCDSLNRPVVTAARRALEASDADVILPFVPADGAAEVRDAFDRTLGHRARRPKRWPTAGSSKLPSGCTVPAKARPFTGLKPAGLDVGPVIPAAERALDSGSPDELIDVLCVSVRDQVTQRHHHAMAFKTHAGEGVESAREYVEATLGLEVWAHSVYKQVLADPHAQLGGHDHA